MPSADEEELLEAKIAREEFLASRYGGQGNFENGRFPIPGVGFPNVLWDSQTQKVFSYGPFFDNFIYMLALPL